MGSTLSVFHKNLEFRALFPDILPEILYMGVLSLSKAQNKAVAKFRKRLKQQRMARLEVHVRRGDATLVRNVIRALTNPDQEPATPPLLREHFGTGQAPGYESLQP